MPEGRFLSKSIAWSDQVGRVSLEADYLFMRMIPHLDREGRILGAPKALKAMCCPLRDEMTPKVIEKALGELAAVKLIVWYEVDGVRYCEAPGFENHQRGARLNREAASRIPSSANGVACVPHDAGLGPEQVRSNGGVTPPKQREVKRSEVKQSEVKRSKALPPDGGSADSVAVPDQHFPAVVYDWLQGAWTARFGVIGIAQFRAGIKALLAAQIRPGQLARAFVAYREDRDDQERPAKFAWFLEDAQKYITLGDQHVVETVSNPSAFGMTEAERTIFAGRHREQLAGLDAHLLEQIIAGEHPPFDQTPHEVAA